MTLATAVRSFAYDLLRRPIGPAVVWLTGLSGSGKSTIAERLVAQLRARGLAVEHLDGDAVRDVFPATGFTREERDAHVRRIGYVASRLEHHGVIVVASFISPYAASRDFARRLCRRFVEVHVATPIDECERRDVKGLYARARRGELRQFTGVDDPYEPPARAELVLDTRRESVEACCRRIVDLLRAPGPIPRHPELGGRHGELSGRHPEPPATSS